MEKIETLAKNILGLHRKSMNCENKIFYTVRKNIRGLAIIFFVFKRGRMIVLQNKEYL